MAADAGGGAQVVVASGMALCTLHLDVGAGEWEACLGMIEVSGLPSGRGVADSALLRHPGGNVVWIRGALEIP